VKVGDLVRFTDRSWGIGIITSKRGIGGFYAYFTQINDFFAICDENQPVEVISESR